ncbi:Hhip [Acrasis kona]|uniref:Hhip n=1 Tax=Acrasis kona TaxID=1008807 RepID=A0AAW2Z429_9EUKA
MIKIIALVGLFVVTVNALNTCALLGTGKPIATKESLADCTWYNDETCCTVQNSVSIKNEWEKSTGATNQTIPDFIRNALLSQCLDLMHQYICLPCSPNNANFYRPKILLIEGKLDLCSSFCDNLYQKCFAAPVDGGTVGTKYSSSSSFCTVGLRPYSNVPITVSTDSTKCFNSGSSLKVSWMLVALTVVATLLFY